jgi:hypothetical protein
MEDHIKKTVPVQKGIKSQKSVEQFWVQQLRFKNTVIKPAARKQSICPNAHI